MNDNHGKDLNKPVEVKVSRLAIIAIILAIAGSVVFYFCLILRIFEIIIFSAMIISIVALVLGIISFIRIEMQGGKITGRNYAILSIIFPVFAGIIFFFFFMLDCYKTNSNALVCQVNLSGIGKAMLIYANDYGDMYPRAGGKDSTWGTSVDWKAATRQKAYGVNNDGTGGEATISSSLYLLVKYSEVEPKHFICPRDLKVTEFYPESVIDRIKKKTGIGKVDRYDKLFSYWDFGSEPWKHNSYSYHMPYGEYSLGLINPPDMAIAADRNPWIPSPGWKVKDFSLFDPDGDKDSIENGNNPCNQNQGQNVLFNDCHVEFKTDSFCGHNNEDNIYTSWNGSDIRKGIKPEVGYDPEFYHNYTEPASDTDSLLLNDPAIKKKN